MARALVNCPNCESQAPADLKWDRFICPHCGKRYEILTHKGAGGSIQVELRPPTLKGARSPSEFAHRNTPRLSDKARNRLQALAAFSFGLSLIVIFSAYELGCFRSFSFSSSSRQAESSDPQKRLLNAGFSSWDGSHRALTQMIKSTMNDPKSYEHVETKINEIGDYFMVTTSFRGKNAFGGVVLNHVTAKIDSTGKVLDIESRGP